MSHTFSLSDGQLEGAGVRMRKTDRDHVVVERSLHLDHLSSDAARVARVDASQRVVMSWICSVTLHPDADDIEYTIVNKRLASRRSSSSLVVQVVVDDACQADHIALWVHQRPLDSSNKNLDKVYYIMSKHIGSV